MEQNQLKKPLPYPRLESVPVKAHDLAGLKFVKQHVQTPIVADESIFSMKDALHIIQTQSADLINIKLMKTGGIHEALKICTVGKPTGWIV